MPTANENIRDALLQRQIYVEKYTAGLQTAVTNLLDATEPDLRTEIERRLGILASAGGGYVFNASTNTQLAQLAQNILSIRSDAINKGFTQVGNDLGTFAVHEADHTDAVMNQNSPVKLDTTLPDPTVLSSIIVSTPFEGRLLKDWASTLSQADQQRIMDQITIGMANGLSTDKIVRNVVGTGILDGTDGVTEQTRRDAASVVQTAVSTTANDARAAFSDANSDIVGDEVWVATLDGNTCEECAALDGQHFPQGEGDQPPAHFNCRCVRVPTLDGQVIGNRPATSVTEDDLADLSPEERAARIQELTGQVPASMTYQEWLSQQSPEFQDEVLGPTRGAMFRDGNLPLSKFVNRDGDVLTLDELKARGPASMFVSPNVDSGLTLDDAINNLDGPRQTAVMDANDRINNLLGLEGDQQSVVGAWTDGAENSVAMDIPSGTDYDTLRAAAAMKGEIGDQKAVLLFQSGEGSQALSQFTLDGNMQDVHDMLLKSGIDQHTLQDLGDGKIGVTVLSTDQQGLEALNDFGAANDITIDTRLGRGEFIGTSLTDGADAVQRADAINQYESIIRNYLADQPADIESGWDRILADWNSVKTTLPGIQAADAKTADAVVNQWIAQSQVRNVDDLMANATANDTLLRDVAAQVQEDTGASFTAGPIKTLARINEKLTTRGLVPAQITDVVRGSFTADSPQQADDIIAALAQRFPVSDENWRFLDTGYFDRTAKILMPDGTVAEIQIAPKALFDAKQVLGGHDLYAEWRALPRDSAAAAAVKQKMIDLYSSARAGLPDSWKSQLDALENSLTR